MTNVPSVFLITSSPTYQRCTHSARLEHVHELTNMVLPSPRLYHTLYPSLGCRILGMSVHIYEELEELTNVGLPSPRLYHTPYATLRYRILGNDSKELRGRGKVRQRPQLLESTPPYMAWHMQCFRQFPLNPFIPSISRNNDPSTHPGRQTL